MKRSIVCLAFALGILQFGPARTAEVDLGDSRLLPIDDPWSVRFQGEVGREKIAQAIKSIAGSREWTVASEAEGRINLTLLVRGQHEVTVEVDYDVSAYSIRYVRSVNLLYAEKLRSGVPLRVIHRRYNGWMKGLVTSANKTIAAPARVVVGFAPLDDAGAVPYIKENGREAYREFSTLPAPRAFAIAPNGAWGRDSYKNVPSNFRRDVVGNALDFCNRRGNNECRLYAIDDRVVWTKTNALAADAKTSPAN